MGTKSYAYIRVSGKGQLKGSGLDRQEQAIRKYVRKAKFDIVKVFAEQGISGTAGEVDRPAFKEMVSEILKNGVRVVIVEGLDRLAREYRIQETLIIYLASKGIDLISARTEENVTEAVQSDPMKKALVQIQGVFSELEKSLLVKKLRTARETVRKARGKCEGQKGYKEFDPTLVREIRRLRRLGKGMDKRAPFRVIAEKLNADGKQTKQGKPFTASGVANILARAS